MDKETLSNYGWIVICVLVLAVMVALATPFGTYVSDAIKSTTEGLFDVEKNALDAAGIVIPGQTIDGGKESQWKGRKWVSFGTSLTATNNTHAPDGTPSGKYTPYLTELSGMTLTNHGVSGGSINGHILYYAYYYRSELRTADLVTIEGSVNDWISSVPLGTVNDTIPRTHGQEDINNYIESIGGTSEGTFAGACYQTFKVIKENAPRAIIVFLTDNTGRYVPTTGGNCSRDKLNSLGLKQQDYIDMAVAVAKKEGITVIDAGALSQVNEEHPEYLIDHIHHTEAGGEQYANAIWKVLNNIAPKCEMLEPIDSTINLFDKNDPEIKNGGIYTGGNVWTVNANYFETGYIKVRSDCAVILYGITTATHIIYCDIDTKEYITGISNGVSGDSISIYGPGSIPNYQKDYVYIRVGLPKSAIDDVVVKQYLVS